MKSSVLKGLGAALALSLGLAGCGGGGSSPSASSGGPVTLSLACWSLSSAPEFKVLADAFHQAHPDITIQLKEYDATNYNTQLIADLSAGKAPDIYVQKNLQNFFTYVDGHQLLDVSDVAASLGTDVQSVADYQVDGKTYAIPYRADSWYLFYNKDLFATAGVAVPDGSWTWDDYDRAAVQLTSALKAKGTKAEGAYQHIWQSVVQGFALAQAPGADLLSGNFSYLKPYYERALQLQKDGAQVSFGTATTGNLSYQSQFGKQKAAMLLMGSWYVATLINQQGSGDADTFQWGIAPAPQYDSSTVKDPVTFGDPTGMGINPKIDAGKLAAAKTFLTFVGSEDAAKLLAAVGITPAYSSDAVTEAYFSGKGVPTDALSKFTFATHDTKPENPVSKATAQVQNILGDAHTAIMSGSSSVDAALSEAQSRAKSEVLDQ